MQDLFKIQMEVCHTEGFQRYGYWLSNQETNLHMSRQLGCRDMCNLWPDQIVFKWEQHVFYKLWIMIWSILYKWYTDTAFNTLRPRQNGRHFADDILKCIFLNENVWIPIKISLKFVPKCPINNIPTLVQIMTLHRPGDKPLSEPMLISLLVHICVTRPQRIKHSYAKEM